MSSGIIRMAAVGAAAVVLASGPSFGQCPSMAKLLAWDRAPEDYFGSALSVSLNWETLRMAVGAWGDDNARGTNAGSVYLFSKPDWQSEWQGDVRLMASDGQANDYFGTSVSMYNQYLVVGATGVSGGRGAAYIFRRDAPGWVQLGRVTPATDLGADLGRSVSAADGWFIVGAPMRDVGAIADAGSAHIYSVAWDGTITLRYTVLGSSAGQNLGASVAAGDGIYAVGVPGGELPNQPTDHGFVRVLRRDFAGVWHDEGSLVAPEPGAGARFGAAVSVVDTMIAVGAPLDDRTAAQGGVLTDSGSVFVYSRGAGGWLLHGEVRASDASGNARFGSSVLIRGGRLIVGAAGAKKAYVFKNVGGEWVQDAVLSDPDGNDNFGASVAMSPYLNEVYVGDWGDDHGGVTNAGAVYVQHLEGLPSDSCAGGTFIEPGMVMGCTAAATRSGTTTCGAPTLQGPDVWYQWTPFCSGTAAVNTFGSMFDTVLSVHTGCPDAGGSNTLACNDDAPGHPGGASALVFQYTAGTTYSIRVSGYNGARGVFVLNLADLSTPANDVCAGAEPVGNGVHTFSLCNATTDIQAMLPCPQVPVRIYWDLWFRYTATCTGEATVDMCGSTGDTIVAVYDGAGCPQDGAGAMVCIDDNFPPTGGCDHPLHPRVSFPAVQGQSYLIRVGSAFPGPSEAVMAISCTPSCRADWNNDDLVNSGDITAFLTDWLGSVQGGTLVGDYNGDGLVNSGDITAFLTAWLAAVGGGC